MRGLLRSGLVVESFDGVAGLFGVAAAEADEGHAKPLARAGTSASGAFRRFPSSSTQTTATFDASGPGCTPRAFRHRSKRMSTPLTGAILATAGWRGKASLARPERLSLTEGMVPPRGAAGGAAAKSG